MWGVRVRGRGREWGDAKAEKAANGIGEAHGHANAKHANPQGKRLVFTVYLPIYILSDRIE